MYLITSGAYISQDLKSEIGNLPPAFLPIKNSRLYEYQIQLINVEESTFMSLPCDYKVKKHDANFLDSKAVTIIETPLNISLGQSVAYALNVIGEYNEPLRILHGDTLIFDLPIDIENFFAVSNTYDNYNWGVLENRTSDEVVYAGYFSISNVKLFLRCLVKRNYEFISALEMYREESGASLVRVKKWLDFGHINTFYRSKALMPSVRYFNSMSINDKIVSKWSTNNNKKILAEANWFQNVPIELRYYLPQLVGLKYTNDIFTYQLEYQYLLSLNDLFVFGEQSTFVWDKILKSCFSFLTKVQQYFPADKRAYLNNDIFLNKTMNRTIQFLSENADFDKELYYSGKRVGKLLDIVDDLKKYIKLPVDSSITIIHGDFCFSNILYDFKKHDIKVIDPRGLNVSEEFDIYGDIRYDFAKLAHSVIGNYDLIIANRYELNNSNDNFEITYPESKETKYIQDIFWEKIEEFKHINIDKQFIMAAMVSLFISMLPLHKESRQRQYAILANALKIYSELKRI